MQNEFMKIGGVLKTLPSVFLHARFCKHSSGVITAGIIIIGDEILNGQTRDTNSSFFITKLNNSGLKVSRISILPDDINAISKEVLELSQTCSVVLTSGGIGPTHDDVTYEAVAKAFGEEVLLREELVSLFQEYYGPEAVNNPGVLKYASIPKSSKLNFADQSKKKIIFPLVSVRNIYMFPGIPGLLQKAFKTFQANFLPYNKPLYVETIFLTLDEFIIISILNKAVKQFEGRIKFGSYPKFNENYYKVKLVLESPNKDWISEAQNFMKQHLPEESIVTLKTDVLSDPITEFNSLCKEYLIYEKAKLITEDVLKKYNCSEICVCFNGGKDCTAVLHLLYCCIHNLESSNWCKIHVLYVKNDDTFPEVEDFIQQTANKYQMNLNIIEGDLKTGFTDFLQDHPHLKVVFLGNRKGDPNSQNLTHFSNTDNHWPSVMRILPILDWSYEDVWRFIRVQQLQYCSLYDRGYTSLGLKSKTKQNSKLLISDTASLTFPRYEPAYLLKDPNDERNGRT